MAETTTTTSTAADTAGAEAQTAQQPAAPTAEQRTAFQKFWDALFGGKEDPAPGSGEGEDNRAPEARVHEEAVVVFQEAGGHIGSDAYLSHSGCKCKYPPGNDHPQSQSAVVFHI